MTKYTNFRWGLTGELQAMLVQNGRVLGRAASLPDGADEQEVDLGGRYLLPAFVDAHCHILPTGLDLQKLHLGPAASHEDVLDMLLERAHEQSEGWILAVHYDQTKYGGEHLTREKLDGIDADRPILLRHVSGHAAVANSAALRAAGVDDATPDPPGGSYGREASGRPNGVLFEAAMEHVSRFQPSPSLEEMVDAILAAGERMRAEGIGAACDMATGVFDLMKELEAYRLAAERGCPIRTRLYLQWSRVFGRRAVSPEQLDAASAALERTGAARVAGVKIFADGAIGAGTAAIYGAYQGGDAGQATSGQLIYPPERVKEMVRIADRAGYSVAVHSIGDYATDLVLDAFAETEDPRRHRIEHAMMLSDAQIERLARLDPFVVLQPEFLLRFGHAYRRQLGPERAARLKRTRSLVDAGLRVAFSSDRPIVAGDPWDGIRAAAWQPDGFDPTECCTPAEALMAATTLAAQVTGDATLEPGATADFQLFDEDPVALAAARRPVAAGGL